jgi:hypothetical protein
MEHGDPAKDHRKRRGFMYSRKEIQEVAALRRGETSRDEPAIAIPIDSAVSLERTNVICPIRPVINLGRSRVGSACCVRS